MENQNSSQRAWTSSGLGRPLDPSYPTNLAIILLSLIASVATALISFLGGSTLLGSFVSAGRIGLYLFLCWALTREIDPDHEGSAFASVLFGLAGLAFIDQPALLVGFWMIGILRVLNRTTGLAATNLDSFVIVLASLWLAWSFDWVLGAVAGLTFVLDSLLHNPAVKHRVLGGLLLLLSGLMYLTGTGMVPTREIQAGTYWLVFVATLLLIPLSLSANHSKSLGDNMGQGLDARRIQSAQVIMLSTAIILLVRSQDGLSASLVEWVPLLGAGTWYLGSTASSAFRALRKS